VNILITGSFGFIGSQLIHFFLNNKTLTSLNIYGVDDKRSGYDIRLASLKDDPRLNLLEADVALLPELSLPNMDWVLHCAATAPLPDNQISHHRSLLNNVANCGAVADFCLKTNSRNIIFMSSSAIYEKNTSLPFTENNVAKQSLLYPTGKFLAEQYFESLIASYNMRVFSLRLANVYGPRQDYFRKQPPLLGYLIRCLLKNERAILYAKGDYGRDYIFIDDLCELIAKIMNFDKPETIISEYGPSFNVGTNTQMSVPEIVVLLEKVAGEKIHYEFREMKNFWSKYEMLNSLPIKLKPELIEQEVKKLTKLNCDKCEAAFNWTANTSFESGLTQCLDFARSLLKDGELK